MIKYFIILLNLVGLIGFKVLFPGGVSITSDLPNNIKSGEDVIVTVNVSKAELNGFAKFTQELPVGFTASLIEGSDATFSFKDQKIKFIWVALPAEESFSFSYKISVDAKASGTHSIGGTFAYIFNNEKQSAELEVKQVSIGAGVIASTPAPTPTKGKIEEVITGIQVKRTTSPISGMQNTFKVELRLDKADLVGFAKIEESIPEGFYASEMESEGGIFSFSNQLVKVIWMSIPDKDQFKISYKLTARDDVSGNQKIPGVFSYLKDDETDKYYIPASTIFIEKDEGDLVPTIIIADEGGNFKEKEVVEPEPVVQVIEEEPIVEILSIPEPESDVTYKVQVAAGHTPVSNDYFAKKFSLTEDISLENHEGWIKYTFGSYGVYKECRDKRNNVWNENSINDAFVTAYNAGSRITVQEALMITNQKWYN